MKKILMIALCLVTMQLSAYSQDSTPAKTKEEKAAEKAAKEAKEKSDYATAGFTDEQIVKIKEVNKEVNEKSKALKGDASLSEDDKKAKMKELSADKKNRIIAIVGEEKYKLWQKAKKESATN